MAGMPARRFEEATAMGDDPSFAPLEHWAAGTVVARYIVLEELGRGGVGSLLRAYDPALQREVALEVVAKEALSGEQRVALVEAVRAMAKVGHPNVLPVYDVETDGEHVMIATAYVAGGTLEGWLARRREPAARRSEVITMFIAAGRGLAAAHREGLAHGQFATRNVLAGVDGRILVTNFGIARALEPHRTAEHEHEAAEDQRAWCEALWEALTGQRAPLDERERGSEAAKPTAPRNSGVPRRIVAALQRGSSADPLARWPSMDALLDEIEREPERRAQRRTVVAMSMALGGVCCALMAVEHQRSTACTGATARIERVWGPQARETVRAGVLSHDLSFASDVLDRIVPKLDAYANEWATLHEETCRATTLRQEQSAAQMDLEMACLQRASRELSAVVSLLGKADTQVVEKAHVLVDSLPRLSLCTDARLLGAEVPPPLPEQEVPVDAIREQLAEAKTLREAAKYGDAAKVLEAAHGASASLGYGPLHTEVLIEQGLLAVALAHYPEAETVLVQALRLGLQYEQVALAQAALMQLMFVAQHRASVAETLAHAEVARGLLAQLGTPPELEADLRDRVGSALQHKGLFQEAEQEQRAAVALLQQAFGPDHLFVAHAYNNLAGSLQRQGRYKETEELDRQALAIREKTLGPEHPLVGISRTNHGSVLLKLGRLAEGEQEAQLAAMQLERALGLVHPATANAINTWGTALALLGRFEEAEAKHRQALEINAKALGPRHVDVAWTHDHLATALFHQKRYDEAEAEDRAALELLVTSYGETHSIVGRSRINLASTLMMRNRLAEARAMLEQAWKTQRATWPPEQRGELAFTFAQLLWESPSERERARQLAQLAIAAFRGSEDRQYHVGKVETWLQSLN